jgi:heat shock protein HslJ
MTMATALLRTMAPFPIAALLAASLASATSCSSPPAAENSPVSLEGTRWTLDSLAGATVTDPRPTLSFEESGRAAGSAGVNRFGGEASIDGRSIRLGPFMATRMAGPPERMELERRYLEALATATRWSIVDGRLELADAEVMLAKFDPATAGIP